MSPFFLSTQVLQDNALTFLFSAFFQEEWFSSSNRHAFLSLTLMAGSPPFSEIPLPSLLSEIAKTLTKP